MLKMAMELLSDAFKLACIPRFPDVSVVNGDPNHLI